MKSRLRVRLDELEKRLEQVKDEIKQANALSARKRWEEKQIKRRIEEAKMERSLIQFCEKFEGKYWKFNIGHEETVMIFVKETKISATRSKSMVGPCIRIRRYDSTTVDYTVKKSAEFTISPLFDDGGMVVCCYDFNSNKKPERLEPSNKEEFIAAAMKGATFITSHLN